MKTKEEILKDLADPIREAVLSAITPIISNAMTMYSDQQNKGLRDIVRVAEIDRHNNQSEIQRLTKEVEGLKRFKAGVHSEELIKELGGMMNADKKLYESILDSPASFHFNNICNRVRTQGEELTRLRELLEKIMAYFDDGTIVRDTSRDGDSDFHERMISFVKLLTEIDNALNHKP